MAEVGATAAARASALLELGRASEAERLLRAALQAEPEDSGLLVLLAQALLGQDKDAEAADVAARAVAMVPDDVMALSCLGAAAAAQKRYGDALKAVRRAVDLAPEFADLHRQHAEILLAKGERAQALAEARRARHLAPDSAPIAAVYGEVLLVNGDTDQAHAEIDRALRLDPENARAHRAAGLFQLRRGGRHESIQRYREALRLEPTNVAARHGLAAALKSRNPVYRGLLLFEVWLSILPSGQRWAVRLAPLVLIRILRTQPDNPVATALSVLVFTFVAMTWATEPVANLIMLTSPTDRALLTRRQRNATAAFAAFAALAIACFIGSVRSSWLIPYGFGFALWALVAGMIHTVTGRRMSRLLIAVAITAATAGIAGLMFLALGLHTASIAASAVLLVSAIPAGWTTALAR
jgi:tetratricopeptide (TPR) repeat protein